MVVAGSCFHYSSAGVSPGISSGRRTFGCASSCRRRRRLHDEAHPNVRRPCLVATARGVLPANKQLPVILPVDTDTSRGVSFLVGTGHPYRRGKKHPDSYQDGLVLTCSHIVAHAKEGVLVAGSRAIVVSSCPADLTLLSVPGTGPVLKKPPTLQAPTGKNVDSLPGNEHRAFAERSRAQPRLGESVCIVNASGAKVAGSIAGLPTVLFGSSGALLPTLLIELVDDDGDTRDRHCQSQSTAVSDHPRIEPGWSGSPVLSQETGLLLGIVSHSASTGRSHPEELITSVNAVPFFILDWFIEHYALTKRTWYDMGAFRKLFVQPLEAAWSRDALTRDLRITVDECGGGVRVVSAPSKSGLLQNDVILRVANYNVSSNGSVQFAGFDTFFPAALVGKVPGESVQVRIARESKGGGVALRDVDVCLGLAEEALLGVGARDSGRRLVAGKGEVRLAELSLDWLSGKFGPEWQHRCGTDLLAVVEGAIGRATEPEGLRHVVVDEWRSQNNEEGHELGYESLEGMRVVAVCGRSIASLEDIELSTAGGSRDGTAGLSVQAQLQNGYVVALPLPIRRITLDGDYAQ